MYGRRTSRVKKITRKWGVFMSAMLKQKLIDIANGFTKYGLWKGGGSSALSEMTDVTLTNLQSNDVLTYNGNEWINDNNLQNQINTLNNNLKVNNYNIQLPSDWIGFCTLYEYGNIGFISFNAYCTNQLNDNGKYGLFSLTPFHFNKSAVGIFKNNGANTTTIFGYLENDIFYFNPHGGNAEPNNYIRGTLVVFK